MILLKIVNMFVYYGDFNSRVGSLQYFVITDDFLTKSQNCNNITQAVNTDVCVLESLGIPLTRSVK